MMSADERELINTKLNDLMSCKDIHIRVVRIHELLPHGQQPSEGPSSQVAEAQSDFPFVNIYCAQLSIVGILDTGRTDPLLKEMIAGTFCFSVHTLGRS